MRVCVGSETTEDRSVPYGSNGSAMSNVDHAPGIFVMAQWIKLGRGKMLKMWSLGAPHLGQLVIHLQEDNERGQECYGFLKATGIDSRL